MTIAKHKRGGKIIQLTIIIKLVDSTIKSEFKIQWIWTKSELNYFTIPILSSRVPISIFIKSNLKNSRVDVTGVRNSFSFTDFTVLHFCCFLFSRLVIIVSFFATRGRVFRLKTVQKSKLSSTILRLTWGFDFELFGDEEEVCYRVQ